MDLVLRRFVAVLVASLMLLGVVSTPPLVGSVEAQELQCGGTLIERIICLEEYLATHPDLVCAALGQVLGGEATFIPASGSEPAQCVVVATTITGESPAGSSGQVFTRTATTTFTVVLTRPLSLADATVLTGCVAPGGQVLTARAAAAIPACTG